MSNQEETNFNIFGRVRRVLMDHLGLDVDQVQPHSTYKTMGMDSLDGVEVTLALEEAFQIEIPDEDFGKAESEEWTVLQVSDYLDQRLKAK